MSNHQQGQPGRLGRILHILLLVLTPLAAGAVGQDPYQILHKHYQAIGGLERLQAVEGSYSEGRVRYDGLNGTFRQWERPPLQYRNEEDFSIISQVEGDSGEEAWLLDTNGQLLIHRHPDTQKRRQIRLLLDRYEHLNPDSSFFSLNFAGITDLDGQECYELILDNRINTDRIHFYFDRQSYLLLGSLYRQPDVEIHGRYGDFRWVDGILVAFYSHTLFLPWEKEVENWTTTHLIDPVIDPKLFALPEKSGDYRISSGKESATVPFRLVENLIYLPVSLAGDTREWVLDSGATMSVIDADYARAMGIEIEGTIRGYGFGELFDLGFAALPPYRVGDIDFASQKVYVSDGLTSRSYEPEIFGILGYDFLSRFVVEIDYDRAEVTLHEPESFSYQGSGRSIAAPLKYRTFTLPVNLEGLPSQWSLDLGAHHSSIHYPFAERHGLLNRDGVDTVSQGMSGISRETTAQFSCLEIDGFRLPGHLVSIPRERGQGATALGEVGGNLGNSTLRHFHLILDYPGQRIILERGKHFDKSGERDKSGLLIGRSEEGQAMVSFLASDSPASRAGLEAGDLIVAMNGEEVTDGQPILPLRERLRGPVGTPITLRLLRQGETLESSFTLADLFADAPVGCPDYLSE